MNAPLDKLGCIAGWMGPKFGNLVGPSLQDPCQKGLKPACAPQLGNILGPQPTKAPFDGLSPPGHELLVALAAFDLSNASDYGPLKVCGANFPSAPPPPSAFRRQR